MRSYSILLFPTIAFILVFCVIPFVSLLMQRALQRRMLRNAGVSPETPGCSNCMYIVRGWVSSICPECGTDVNGTEVRTGVDLNKNHKSIMTFGIAVLIAVFGLFPFGVWLFETYSHSGQWSAMSVRSKGAILFSIQVGTSHESRHFPPKYKNATMLRIKSNVPIEPKDHLSNDQDQIEKVEYWERRGYRVIYFENTEDIPTDEEMSVFLGEALEHDAVAMKLYAVEINNVLKAVSELDRGQSFNISSSAPSFQFFNNNPSRNYELWTPGIYLILLSSIIIVVGLPAYVIQRHIPGFRLVKEGEWLTTSDSYSTTN